MNDAERVVWETGAKSVKLFFAFVYFLKLTEKRFLYYNNVKLPQNYIMKYKFTSNYVIYVNKILNKR